MSMCECTHYMLFVCACLPVTFEASVTYNSTWGLSPSLFRLSAYWCHFLTFVLFPMLIKLVSASIKAYYLSLFFFSCKQGSNLFCLNASSSSLLPSLLPEILEIVDCDVTDGPTDLRLFEMLASLALKNSSSEIRIPRHWTLMNFNSSATKEFKRGKSQFIRS